MEQHFGLPTFDDLHSEELPTDNNGDKTELRQERKESGYDVGALCAEKLRTVLRDKADGSITDEQLAAHYQPEFDIIASQIPQRWEEMDAHEVENWLKVFERNFQEGKFRRSFKSLPHEERLAFLERHISRYRELIQGRFADEYASWSRLRPLPEDVDVVMTQGESEFSTRHQDYLQMRARLLDDLATFDINLKWSDLTPGYQRAFIRQLDWADLYGDQYKRAVMQRLAERDTRFVELDMELIDRKQLIGGPLVDQVMPVVRDLQKLVSRSEEGSVFLRHESGGDFSMHRYLDAPSMPYFGVPPEKYGAFAEDEFGVHAVATTLPGVELRETRSEPKEPGEKPSIFSELVYIPGAE